MPKPAGSVIRSLRQQRGIKTGALATRLGITRQHMTNIESGWSTSASIELLNRMAEVLNVEASALVEPDPGGRDHDTPDPGDSALAS